MDLIEKISIVFFFGIKQDYNISDYHNFYYRKILSTQIHQFSKNNCKLTEFNSEYLFCCGDMNYIKCFRIDNDFNLIKQFNILLEGEISYLNIQNNNNYLIFYYMNTNRGINQIYEYYILLPTREEKDLKITNNIRQATDHLNIERSKRNNLFTVKSNKYYLQLNNPYNDIGYFTMNGNILDSERKLIEGSIINLDFIVTNPSEVNNRIISVDYNISVEDEEAYSTQCQVNLHIFSSCSHNCKNCSSQNLCEECSPGFDFLEGSNICYDSSLTEKGYYLIESEIGGKVQKIFKECYESCKKCSGGLEINTETNEENHNCDECFDNYYKLENNSYPKNCYDYDTIQAWKSYEDHFSNTLENTNMKEAGKLEENSDKNINIAESSYIIQSIKTNRNNFNIKTQIKTSFSPYTNNIDEDQYENLEAEDSTQKENINISTEDYKQINDISDEEYSSEREENSYTKDLIQCDEACLSCYKEPENNKTNCIQCNTENGYYPLYNENSNCINNETNHIGYYLDKNQSPFTWKQCYEKCETCFSGRNSLSMNCLSCKINLENNKRLFYDISKHNCIEACPNNTYITSESYCVSTCPSGTLLFILNNSCLDSCPNGYEKSQTNDECILKVFDQTTLVKEFKKTIMNDITSFFNSSKIINGSNFIAVVFSSDDMNPE